MLITLQDDGVLYIYPSVQDAVLDVEALDAENTFRAVFGETGHRYAIHWIRKNQRGLFMVGNGEYMLVRDGTVDAGALPALIRDAKLVDPESLRPWLGDLGEPAAQRRSVRRLTE
jgi:hypothetical protein